MRLLSPDLVKDKTVLLRMDLDVPVKDGKVLDDFRLVCGLDTLELCLQYAKSVIICGHLGRPDGHDDPTLSVAPIVHWFETVLGYLELPPGKLHILENLRFEKGEDDCDESYAKELANLGDFFVNESFAAYHKSASTYLLPKLLPSAAGLRFAAEVEHLKNIRENPQKPLVVIIGGAKIEDKLPVVESMSKIADHILVGGKLPIEAKEQNISFSENVHIGELNEDQSDINSQTLEQWREILNSANMIVWNGPVGKIDHEASVDNLGSAKGTYDLAKIISESGKNSLVGGGDTIAALETFKMLDKFSFVSTGGGAMLKFLAEGTLPTIEALS